MATPYVAVVGPGDATESELETAAAVGRRLAESGVVLVTGGLGGVMAAACRGAAEAGGMTVGILPGVQRSDANEHVRIALATGLGELRNGLVVRAVDAVIAVGGAFGTLSEVALALKTGVPVIGLQTWEIDGVERASTAADAVARTLARCAASRPRGA
jgi:uncharacterized protein (TIGR00725 family)